MKLLWCVIQMDGGGGDKTDLDRLPYCPITSSLDHNMLCYFQDPFSTSASWPGLLNWRPLRVTAPSSALTLWPSLSQTLNWRPPNLRQQSPAGHSLWLQLALTLSFTVSNCNWLYCHGHLHILFHNAHLFPLRSRDILPFIYTGASLIDDVTRVLTEIVSAVLYDMRLG